jgi:uncharacterized protein (TIGR04255 family)
MANSPLVEIIAEIRWGDGNPQAPALLASAIDDSIYVRLGIEVGKLGYHQLERTVPEGFPVPGGAVIYRYRKAEGEQNTLYQLGPGIFTANGLPPYNSWEEFLPVIESGLRALWRVAPISQELPIFLSLRYLDAFTGDHLDGMSVGEFFKEIVGLEYDKPESFAAFSEDGAVTAMRFMATQKSNDGRELWIDVAEGSKEGADAIVINTLARAAQFNAASVDDVLIRFEPLHKALHDVFFEMIGRNSRLQTHLFETKD